MARKARQGMTGARALRTDERGVVFRGKQRQMDRKSLNNRMVRGVRARMR